MPLHKQMCFLDKNAIETGLFYVGVVCEYQTVPMDPYLWMPVRGLNTRSPITTATILSSIAMTVW